MGELADGRELCCCQPALDSNRYRNDAILIFPLLVELCAAHEPPSRGSATKAGASYCYCQTVNNSLLAGPVSNAICLVRPGHPLLSRRELSLADIVAFPIICNGRLPTQIATAVHSARKSRDAGRPVPDVACESHEIMRRIAVDTDHVLLPTLAANAKVIGNGELVPLPFADPLFSATFAIIRIRARTLPPVADEPIREVIAADRAALEVARELAGRFFRSPPARSLAARSPKRRG